ncbi:MAG: hypothetical protein V1835_03105 [Candidatus Micrarchaeota archaeon]
MKYECDNCKLLFESDDPQICPRCSSKKIRHASERKKFDTKLATTTHQHEKVAYSHTSFVGRDGKEGWRDFHKAEVRGCADCGGIDFDLNWKHKEKVCKKCGAIYPLPRRMG